MKKILLPILVACALALPLRGQTILVIDVNGVFNNLTEVKSEIEKLKIAVSQYNDFLAEQAKGLQDLQGKVNLLQQQAENPALTQEGRDALKKQFTDQASALDNQKQQFLRDQQTSQTLVQQKQTQLVQTELQKIHDQVTLIAEKRKASLVLNKSDNGLVSSVIYSDKSFDISSEVQDALNKAAEATATAPAAAPTAMAPAASSSRPAAGTGTSK